MSLQKQIKCSRCHSLKTVPIDWHYKECVKCHERTDRRFKRRTPIEKIEAKAIGQIINFESAWRRYKRFIRKYGKKGMTKEQFRKDYFETQNVKISQIKAIINKYNDKNAPILSHDCLKFRFLLAQRSQHFDKTQFTLRGKEHTFFYHHIANCYSCNRYFAMHKDDLPLPQLVDLGDKEASQTEFNGAMNEFWDTIKGKSKRSIDDILDSMEDVTL